MDPVPKTPNKDKKDHKNQRGRPVKKVEITMKVVEMVRRIKIPHLKG